MKKENGARTTVESANNKSVSINFVLDSRKTFGKILDRQSAQSKTNYVAKFGVVERAVFTHLHQCQALAAIVLARYLHVSAKPFPLGVDDDDDSGHCGNISREYGHPSPSVARPLRLRLLLVFRHLAIASRNERWRVKGDRTSMASNTSSSCVVACRPTFSRVAVSLP